MSLALPSHAASLELTNVAQTRSISSYNHHADGSAPDDAFTAFAILNTNIYVLNYRIQLTTNGLSAGLALIQAQIDALVGSGTNNITDVTVTNIFAYLIQFPTNWLHTNITAHLTWLTNHHQVHPDLPYQFDQGVTNRLLSWDASTKQLWQTEVSMIDDGIWHFPAGIRANLAYATNLPLSSLQAGGATFNQLLRFNGTNWVPSTEFGISSNAVVSLNTALSNTLWSIIATNRAPYATNAGSADRADQANELFILPEHHFVSSAVDTSPLISWAADGSIHFHTNVTGLGLGTIASHDSTDYLPQPPDTNGWSYLNIGYGVLLHPGQGEFAYRSTDFYRHPGIGSPYYKMTIPLEVDAAMMTGADAENLFSQGVIPPQYLGLDTPSATTVLNGDQAWIPIPVVIAGTGVSVVTNGAGNAYTVSVSTTAATWDIDDTHATTSGQTLTNVTWTIADGEMQLVRYTYLGVGPTPGSDRLWADVLAVFTRSGSTITRHEQIDIANSGAAIHVNAVVVDSSTIGLETSGQSGDWDWIIWGNVRSKTR